MDPNENVERVEVSELPAHVIEQARARPGGSVAQIDGSMVSNPDGYVPPEAIVGVYEVGADGVLTGNFIRNPNHGQPIVDDWSKLDDSGQWLGWLPATPSASVRRELELAVDRQIPGTVVEWVKVIDDPVFLTGGVRQVDDSDKVLVRRTALAIQFAQSVVTPNGRREILVGSFTWVAAGMDKPEQRKDRTWFDLGMPVSRAGELLDQRIYELDA